MSHEKCIADGCNREIFVKKHQLCRTHVNQLYMKGTITNSAIKSRKQLKPFPQTLQALTKKKGNNEIANRNT